MTISVGDKIPAGMLTKVTEAGPAPVSTEAFFAGRKVALPSLAPLFASTIAAGIRYKAHQSRSRFF